MEAEQPGIEPGGYVGAADGVVTDLRSLVLQHSPRERLWVLLMTALYRIGQQTDALAAYGEARRALAEELGLEPGPELHRLQEQILRADPVLDAEPAAVNAELRSVRTLGAAYAGSAPTCNRPRTAEVRVQG